VIKGTIFSLERVPGYNFVVHAFSVLNQLLKITDSKGRGLCLQDGERGRCSLFVGK